MNSELVKNILEAALLVAEKPLTPERLLQLFDPAEQEALPLAIEEALAQLEKDYDGRGIELKKVASGYRFQARIEVAPWVNRLWDEKPARYSRAFMETLAIIAYRQPITRGEIEEIRGVGVSSHIIKTLMERDWLRVAGHRDVPGRPAVYVTTPQFLDYFNLDSLAELPVLRDPGDIESIVTEGFEPIDETEVEGPEAANADCLPGEISTENHDEADAALTTVPENGESVWTEEVSVVASVGTAETPGILNLDALDDLSEDQLTEQIALAESAAEREDEDGADEEMASQAAQAWGSS